MYKVSEVAKLVGVSTAAIYKELKRIDNKFITVDNGKKFITEEGFRYFQERYKSKESVPVDDDIVRSLLAQMEEKDRQIAERDKQINQLIEQSKNYQILLKTEQDKMVIVAQEKPKLLSRLFHR